MLKEFIEQAKKRKSYKEVDYDKMTDINGNDVIVLSQGKCMGIDYKVVFYTLGHPCAYIRIPKGSKLYGVSYTEVKPYTCHGGFTYGRFCGKANNKILEGYWLGWDYGHCDDYSKIYENIAGLKHNKKWTTEEILEDVFYQVKALIDTKQI